jgi:hypothetical protein
MPLERIGDYLRAHMQEIHLATDEVLVSYLAEQLDSNSKHEKGERKLADLELAIKHSPIFAELRDDVKASFLSGLHGDGQLQQGELAPKHKLHN